MFEEKNIFLFRNRFDEIPPVCLDHGPHVFCQIYKEMTKYHSFLSFGMETTMQQFYTVITIYKKIIYMGYGIKQDKYRIDPG